MLAFLAFEARTQTNAEMNGSCCRKASDYLEMVIRRFCLMQHERHSRMLQWMMPLKQMTLLKGLETQLSDSSFGQAMFLLLLFSIVQPDTQTYIIRGHAWPFLFVV